jgi:hypothetical protein
VTKLSNKDKPNDDRTIEKIQKHVYQLACTQPEERRKYLSVRERDKPCVPKPTYTSNSLIIVHRK